MTSTIQELVKQIVDYEAQRSLAELSPIDIVLLVCEKLRIYLSTLVGNAGYHAFVTRALVLLTRNHPWAESFHVQDDGSIKLDPIPATHSHVHLIMSEAVAIPAQLLALLSIFIGETLTFTLAREMWPELPSGAMRTEGIVK